MANKKSEIEKFDKIVQDVLNLKIPYTTLSYKEKTDPKIHEALLEAQVICSLEFSGYAVELGLFYVREAYLSRNENESRWNRPLEIDSPKKDYSYFQAPTIFFDSFDEYYNYLFGDIYDINDCFYQYHFSKDEIEKYNLKVKQLNFGDKYDLMKLNEIIVSIEDSEELREKIKEIDQKETKETEGIKLLSEAIINSKSWDEYLNSMNDLNNDFCKDNNIEIEKLFLNSKFQKKIFGQIKDRKKDEILKYFFMSIYSPEVRLVSRQTFISMLEKNIGCDEVHKFANYIKDHIDDIDNKIINTIFYRKKETDYYKIPNYKTRVLKSIDEYNVGITTRQAITPNHVHIENKESKLGVNSKIKGVTFEIEKEIRNSINKYSYKRNDINLKDFDINLTFYYHGQNILDKYYSCNYLSEYLYVLDGNLSNMDLSNFRGLEKIDDFSKINLHNSILRSSVKEKVGIKIDDKYYKENVNLDYVDFSKNNELAALEQNNVPATRDNDYDDYKIYYISDIHLEHRFMSRGDIEKSEIDDTMHHIANNVTFTPRNKKYDNVVIVNGDICHNQQIYKDFLKALKNSKHYNTKYIIFTLGNHEYWECAGQSVNEIVAQYRKLIKSYSSYDTSFRLLQNSILYINYNDIMHEITEDQLIQYTDEKLQKELSNARLIFFGGTGFAGCNDKYNADCGLYRYTLNRKQEIEESEKFNDLYEKVCRCSLDKKVIVITHNPKIDWSGNEDYHKNFIYISGHTHRNTYYISDDYSVYADNQIGYYGYKTSYPKTRYLDFDASVDIFGFYKDGIYEISEEQYECFLRCKNIVVDGYIHGWGNIYMLKKEGYYCFIFETEERKKLSILNGNVRKALIGKDIKYYYDNMLNVIHQIDAPLFKYTDLQKAISSEVKSFGGDGKIHGCIIDIDYYNHIYLNPYDLTLVPYNAPNIKERDVYKSVPSLLEDKRPNMYAKYIESNEEIQYSLIVPSKNTRSNKKYQHDEGTYPYTASRMMSKLQRINKNILTEWIPPIEKEDDGSIKQIGIDECTNDELKQIVKKESEK